MKKILVVLLAIFMVTSLVACSDKNNEEETKPEEEVEEVIEDDGEIVGGYTESEDKAITDELKEIFDKAMEGYVGNNFEPIELIGTQVVAGINYKFLCKASDESQKIVTIYKDLEGNCEITDVEDVK